MSRLYQQRVRKQQMCLCVCVCEREKDQFRIYCINDNTFFSPKNKSYVMVKTCFGGYSQKKQHLLLFFGWGLGVGSFGNKPTEVFIFSVLCTQCNISRKSLSCVSGMQTLSVISFQCATVRKSIPFIVTCCGLSATSIYRLKRETASYLQS